MPNVNEFLRGAVAGMPATFGEKELAIQFLDEQASIDRKKELAIALLESVAASCECSDTWKALVKNRLDSAEKAMRYLLPAHRDHILHSAHLYLLGLAIYLKMLRPNIALRAVLGDTHWRDAQALFGSPQVSYACLPSVVSPCNDLNTLTQRLTRGTESVSLQDIEMMMLTCRACSPSDGATDASRRLAQGFAPFRVCCGPSGHIIQAVDQIASAIRGLDAGSLCVYDHCPHSLDDLDAVFRRRWGMAALLHDAAYPLELAAKQIQDYIVGSIASLRCSTSPCSTSFGITLKCMCDFITIPLLQNVCSERFNPDMFGDNSIRLLATNICHKLHVEYSPETLTRIMASWLEANLQEGKVDHGIFSALLMLQHINAELVRKLGDRRHNRELVYDNLGRRVTERHTASAVEFFYIECVDAAAAVYLHNAVTYIDLFKERPIDYRDHPIAWLLFLCDQLQEWLRPSGDPSEEPLKLFQQAEKYTLVLDDGPKLVFCYPGDSDRVTKSLRRHLSLFGEDFIIQGKQSI